MQGWIFHFVACTRCCACRCQVLAAGQSNLAAISGLVNVDASLGSSKGRYGGLASALKLRVLRHWSLEIAGCGILNTSRALQSYIRSFSIHAHGRRSHSKFLNPRRLELRLGLQTLSSAGPDTRMPHPDKSHGWRLTFGGMRQPPTA